MTEKTIFRSLLTKNNPVYTNPGSRMMPDYEMQINPDTGMKELKQIGEHDIYPEIQSYLEDTLVENIVRRATLGDPTALNAIEGNFVDCTNMPVSLMDAQNKILKIEREFNQLPLEIREKYNYSVEKYISEYGSESWAENLGLIKKEEKTIEQGNGNALQPSAENGNEEK